MRHLCSIFPRNIKCVVGIHDGELVAGVILFQHGKVVHTQYIASKQQSPDTSALEMVIEHSLNQSKAGGMRYFDFGTSNEPDSGLLNDGLHWFKSKFGAGSVQHDYFELSLH